VLLWFGAHACARLALGVACRAYENGLPPRVRLQNGLFFNETGPPENEWQKCWKGASVPADI